MNLKKNDILRTPQYIIDALHPTEDDSIADFIEKMQLLHFEIGQFIDYLKTQNNNRPSQGLKLQ